MSNKQDPTRGNGVHIWTARGNPKKKPSTAHKPNWHKAKSNRPEKEAKDHKNF
jgi:hypothetical protein